MPYLTPDAPPTGTVCRTIVIPDDPKWKSLVNGALSELFKVWNFEQDGSYTPQQTADYFLELWTNFHESECMVIPVGMIAPFGQNDAQVPAKWLWCAGQAVSRSTYAALFAIISTAYGVGNGTTTFNLPDLRNRFLYGAPSQNPSTINATAGETNHVLTVAELPAHHHAQNQNTAGTTGVNRTLGGNSSNTASAGLNTADTGSGTAHNNMPPYMLMQYAIYAGV